MKLIDTLSTKDKIDLLNGTVVGIFPTMVLSTDAFYNKLYELCLGYYMQRSGAKTISLTYNRFIEFVNEHGGYEPFASSDADNFATVNGAEVYVKKDADTPESFMGKLIRGKFLEKWNRIYEVLISEQYNALLNRESEDKRTASNQNKDTHDTTIGKTGTNTDTTTFDTNVEDNGNTGTHEKTTRSVDNTNDIYGFNSTSPVGDSVSNEAVDETIVGDKELNTNHNLQTKTGTESKVFGIAESETHTGTDTTDITIDESVIKTGRYGVGADLVTKELNLRNTQIFFDIIYADIDSIATLQIYI